jgi:hypothetical protein
MLTTNYVMGTMLIGVARPALMDTVNGTDISRRTRGSRIFVCRGTA